jgi:hypothetical protein
VTTHELNVQPVRDRRPPADTSRAPTAVAAVNHPRPALRPQDQRCVLSVQSRGRRSAPPGANVPTPSTTRGPSIGRVALRWCPPRRAAVEIADVGPPTPAISTDRFRSPTSCRATPVFGAPRTSTSRWPSYTCTADSGSFGRATTGIRGTASGHQSAAMSFMADSGSGTHRASDAKSG